MKRKILFMIKFSIIIFGVIFFPIGLFELGFYLGYMKGKKIEIIKPIEEKHSEDKELVSLNSEKNIDGVLEI